MGHGDDILIHVLKKLWRQEHGRDEDEDYFPRSVADFSVDFILASCCLMLNAIATEKDNDKGNVLDEVEKLALPTNNPPSMAARYNLGSQLADICSQLGFVDSSGFGCQTFLYGSEAELRQLFMFLVDKMPIEKEEVDEDPCKEADVVTECVADVDPFCSCPICLSDLSAYDAVRILPRESRNAAFNLFSKANTNHTMIVNHTGRSSDVTTVTVAKKWEDHKSVTDEVKTVDANGTNSEQSVTDEGHLDILKGLKEEKEDKERELYENQQRYKTLRGDIIALRSDSKHLVEAIAMGERENADLRVDYERRSKMAELIGEDLENLNRLKTRAAKSDEKMTALRSEWEKARGELVTEGGDLSFQLEVFTAARGGSSQWNQTLVDVTEMISKAELQLAKKESAVEKHSFAVAKMLDLRTAGGERPSYTKRILDILESIRKQREETNKVIADIQQTQRDINLLEGKLDRTYGEVNYKVFEVARSEPLLLPTYRHIINLHHMCADIVETLRTIGRTKRAARDIRDAVEGEKLRRSGEKLERIKGDLETLTRENKMLRR